MKMVVFGYYLVIGKKHLLMKWLPLLSAKAVLKISQEVFEIGCFGCFSVIGKKHFLIEWLSLLSAKAVFKVSQEAFEIGCFWLLFSNWQKALAD